MTRLPAKQSKKYQPKKPRKPTRAEVPLESAEADTFMSYLRQRGLRFTHVKNETGRADASGKVMNWKAVWDKRDGVSKGFPDFAVVLPGIGLALPELKREYYGVTSGEQLEWIDALNTCPGVEARVCEGAKAAIAFIEELSPSPIGAAFLDDSVF